MEKTFKNKLKVCAIAVVALAVFASAWLLFSYWFLTVDETVDEFGTPRSRWNWTYGLIDGEIEVLSCEGFNTDFEDEAFEFQIPNVVVSDFQDGERQVISEETFILSGGGNWDYLQIRVNGELVRHRWPRLDAHFLVGPDFREFLTEEFDLQIGINIVTLVAIIPGYIPGRYPSRDVDNCVIKTIYIIREG